MIKCTIIANQMCVLMCRTTIKLYYHDVYVLPVLNIVPQITRVIQVINITVILLAKLV